MKGQHEILASESNVLSAGWTRIAYAYITQIYFYEFSGRNMRAIFSITGQKAIINFCLWLRSPFCSPETSSYQHRPYATSSDTRSSTDETDWEANTRTHAQIRSWVWRELWIQESRPWFHDAVSVCRLQPLSLFLPLANNNCCFCWSLTLSFTI